MGTNAEYIARMKAQLRQWDVKVEALVAAHKNASAEALAAHDERLKDLRANRAAAHKVFQELCVANEALGQPLQAAMDKAWIKMQDALSKLSSSRL